MLKQKRTLTVCIILIVVFSAGVFASSTLEKITAYHDYSIKITFNGQVFQPVEQDGTLIRPIIYNGRTFLPIRAIAELAGMQVDWDDYTKTVILEKQEETDIISAEPQEDSQNYEEESGELPAQDTAAELTQDEETEPPRVVVSTFPSGNAVNVRISTPIYIYFNRPFAEETEAEDFSAVIKDSSGKEFRMPALEVTSGDSIGWNVHEDFSPNTKYTVEVYSSLEKECIHAFSFTTANQTNVYDDNQQTDITEDEDAKPVPDAGNTTPSDENSSLSVVSSFPAKDAVNVGISTPIYIYFNRPLAEEMEAEDFSAVIKDSSGKEFKMPPLEVTSGDSVGWHVHDYFSPNTRYTVELYYSSGNELLYKLDFTTWDKSYSERRD